MFRFRKHRNEIAFAIHIGYDIQFHDFRITLNFYKYEMTLEKVNYV